MAGDWIKVRCDLHTHPKCVRIASALKADILRTVGGLHRLWSIADAHSSDGHLDGYTLAILDSMVGWVGFGKAVAAVGWLQVVDSGLIVPEFGTHNGQSAKRRAQDSVRKMSARDADKTRTREEKRREETVPPTAGAEPAGSGRRARRNAGSVLENRKEPAAARVFSDGWCARFLAAKGSPYGFDRGKDAKQVEAILGLAGRRADSSPEQAAAAVALALERADVLLSSTDAFYADKGIDLGTLRSAWNRLGSAKAGGNGRHDVRVGRADAAPHELFKETGRVTL